MALSSKMTNAFTDFLGRKAYDWDKEIMQSVRSDPGFYNVIKDEPQPDPHDDFVTGVEQARAREEFWRWFKTREMVRKLSEGLAYG